MRGIQLETSSKRFEDVLRYDTARIPLNSVINRIETSKIQLFKDTKCIGKTGLISKFLLIFYFKRGIFFFNIFDEIF